jgi:hypothetical protein
MKPTVLLVGAVLAAPASLAGEDRAGGYLSFCPPKDVPATLDQVEFPFAVVSHPGAGANAFYTQHFAFKLGRGLPPLNGYMGLAAKAWGGGNKTYAVATLWVDKEQEAKILWEDGPHAKCTFVEDAREGSMITCAMTDGNPLGQSEMPINAQYRPYIRRVEDLPSIPAYEFGIKSLSNRPASVPPKTVLATIAFSPADIPVLGLDAHYFSHFLEYPSGNRCDQVPYTAYNEGGPVGYAKGRTYEYTVWDHPGAGSQIRHCNSQVRFSADHTTAMVEVRRPAPPDTPPSPLHCDRL